MKNYLNQDKLAEQMLGQLNMNLSFLFKENGIKKFNFLSVGNSISSGYSALRTTKPLLLRNEGIKSDMARYGGVECGLYHFARAQNNNDEHIYDWIMSDIKLSEIYKMNRNDYEIGPTRMKITGLTDAQIEQYYPLKTEADKGLKELILESSPTLANIVVYNGLTGSFLDGFTRKGNLLQKTTYGISRDLMSVRATLSYIQGQNRINGTHTQVYLCGIPNFLGIYISEVFNHNLKSLAQQYANVSYVKPPRSKFFYEPNIEEDRKEQIPVFHKKIDIHYDEMEYMKLNQNILTSIYKNYLKNEAMISIDRKLVSFNSVVELEQEKILQNNNSLDWYINQTIGNIILEECEKTNNKETQKKILQQLYSYLKNRFCYDFYYLGKDHIESSITRQYIKVASKKD